MIGLKDKNKTLRSIDAPHYRYWQALYHAFFNSKLYVDVGKRWKGFSFLYLLLLISIATIPLYFMVLKSYNDNFVHNLSEPLEQLPRLYIQNGQITANETMPVLIKNNKGAVTIIVDTTGKITNFDKQYPQLSLLITNDSIKFRLPVLDFNVAEKPEGEVVSEVLPKNLNQIFDAKEWILSKQIRYTKLFLNVVLYPCMVMLIFGTYLVLLLALSLMAQFVAKILIKFDLTYLQSFRLLMVAATPQVFVTLLFSALGWVFQGFGMLSLVLFAAYFSFAAISMKRASNKMVLG